MPRDLQDGREDDGEDAMSQESCKYASIRIIAGNFIKTHLPTKSILVPCP